LGDLPAMPSASKREVKPGTAIEQFLFYWNATDSRNDKSMKCAPSLTVKVLLVIPMTIGDNINNSKK